MWPAHWVTGMSGSVQIVGEVCPSFEVFRGRDVEHRRVGPGNHVCLGENGRDIHPQLRQLHPLSRAGHLGRLCEHFNNGVVEYVHDGRSIQYTNLHNTV